MKLSAKQYINGLKFGMLLQLAVGPMCLMVFNTAKNSGFIIAMALVAAIALVDAFYILLAGFGASKLLEKKGIKNAVKIIGALVLMLFGLNMVLGAFGINLIPGLNLEPNTANIFIQGLILTLSNPITIIFWGSVLTTKIIEDHLKKNELILFSIGLVSSTIFFLTAVALLGTVLSSFIPDTVLNILNAIVGLIIIFFGIKLLVKKQANISKANKRVK